MPAEAGVDEPGGDVGEQPEASERRLAVEAGDDVVGDRHHLERGAEHELAGMEDEATVVGDLDELGEVLLRLLRIDEGRRVVAEHAEVAVDPQVDRRRLHARRRRAGRSTMRPASSSSRIVRSDRITAAEPKGWSLYDPASTRV